MIPLTVPEIRRLLRALQEPPARFGFRLAWSVWRRRHQAVAQRGHRARRAQRHTATLDAASSSGGVRLLGSAPPLPLPSPGLSEAEWQRILPLLPPQTPRVGRPAHPHRPLVETMIWVERTGASWRQIPPHHGPWQRVYNRYRLWRASGLWARISAAVAPVPDARDGPTLLPTLYAQENVA